MSVSFVLYGLVPLLLFVILDMFAGIRIALVTAFLAAVGELFVIHHQTGEWDKLSFIAAGLILVLGYFSWKTNDKKYVKFQPVILSLLLAGFLAYMQLSTEPLIFRYQSIILQILPESYKDYFTDPAFINLLNFFTNWAIGLFIINAALIAYTAIYCSTWIWIIARGFGFWILAALMLALQLVYLFLRYKS